MRTKRIEMVMRSSDASAIKTRLRGKVDVSAKWQAVRRILLGGDDSKTFLAELVTNSDGSGNAVAVGLGSWVTDKELDRLRNIKDELTAEQRSRVEVRAFDPEVNTTTFWEWVAAFSTPLYQKQGD